MEWKEVRLGDVCEIKHGFAYKGKYFSDTPTCDILVTPGNFTLSGGFKLDKPKFYNGPVEKDYILSKGDLIVTMTDLSKNIDTLGYSALVPEVKGLTFHHNQRIGLVENIANNVDKYFLYWIMRTPAYQSFIATHSSGTTVHHTSPKGIGNYVFKLPPLDDQRRIASILSSLDRKIELNNKINADLEEMAQAIFKNWFVDFEPFKDGKFVDSELGMIPEGWKVISLSEIMKYNGGSQPPASEFIDTYQEGYIRFIQIRDYDNDSHITYIPISKRNKLCDELDIMIARYGAALGRICWGLKGAYNVALAKVIPIKSYYREYLRCYLNTSYFYQSINNKGARCAQSGFNQSDINSYMIAFPIDETVVMNFNDLCSSIMDKRLSLKYENSRLSTLRDTLLPRLMSGELEVPE